MRNRGFVVLAVALGLFALGPAWAQEGGVARAQFTSGIENREPVDALQSIGLDSREVVFFTELRDLEGRAVAHRWIHEGETRAVVDFDVGGPRWRVWSSKDLIPQMQGEWTVEVVDDTGTSHGQWSFTYGEGEGTEAGE